MSDKDLTSFLKELDETRVYKRTSMVSKDDLLNNGVVIYGAGLFGGTVARGLLSQGITPDWFVDTNPSVVAKGKLENIVIRGVDSLKDIRSHFVILASSYINEMKAECNNHNVKNYILSYSISNIVPILGDYGFSEDLMQYSDELNLVYSFLKDDMSKKVFRDFLNFHLTFDLSVFAIFEPKMYFPSDLTDKIDYSFFVDAGAFVGDTLKPWLDFFKPERGGREYSYHAFEPIPRQFDELSSYINGLSLVVRQHITPLNMALGDRESVMEIIDHGPASHVVGNEAHKSTEMKKVRVTTIDSVFADKKTTMIKADVEGFEIPLLNGGREVIKRDRPSLAISVYHRFKDLFEVPLLINSLNLDYDIYFRHHQRVYSDTVCYAISRS
jgi:FkbM family methyltransferase